jgi:hypothetical protein
MLSGQLAPRPELEPQVSLRAESLQVLAVSQREPGPPLLEPQLRVPRVLVRPARLQRAWAARAA